MLGPMLTPAGREGLAVPPVSSLGLAVSMQHFNPRRRLRYTENISCRHHDGMIYSPYTEGGADHNATPVTHVT